jgi:predicted O-methyltransferase YrrM
VSQTYKQLEAFIALSQFIKARYPLPPMRGWAISPDFALILLTHIRKYQPQTIVELGSGVSTLVAGYTLEQQQKGRIISIDHAEQFSAVTQENVLQHGLQAYVHFIHAPLKTVEMNGERWEWYDLAALDAHTPIDLLVVDGPPQYGNTQAMTRYLAVPVFYEQLVTGGFVLVDDANRQDEQQIVERWLKEYNLYEVTDFYTEKGTRLLRKR